MRTNGAVPHFESREGREPVGQLQRGRPLFLQSVDFAAFRKAAMRSLCYCSERIIAPSSLRCRSGQFATELADEGVYLPCASFPPPGDA